MRIISEGKLKESTTVALPFVKWIGEVGDACEDHRVTVHIFKDYLDRDEAPIFAIDYDWVIFELTSNKLSFGDTHNKGKRIQIPFDRHGSLTRNSSFAGVLYSYSDDKYNVQISYD